MKKLALAAALAVLASLSAPSVFAGSVSENVSVTVNLLSACKMSVPSGITINYTSFGAAVASTATEGTFTVNCTDGLTYNIGFDTATPPATTKAVTAAAANNNLTYTLSLDSSTGTGAGGTVRNHRVIATVAAGQAGGTCAAASCSGTAETHTVYVAY